MSDSPPVPPDRLDIRDVPDALRYEARDTASGSAPAPVAVASYSMAGTKITFEHTRVPDAMAGRHVGTRLVKFALDNVRSRGLRVVPRCPFVAAYIKRHKEYQDLLA